MWFQVGKRSPEAVNMAFTDWIIIVLFIGCFTRPVINCQNTPRIVYAIDSSEEISKADFEDQRSLIDSVVVDLGGNADDVAVVLYNTDVQVAIKFGQFNGFAPLGDAINNLSRMTSVSRGSDLEKLFNTTFTRIPEVLLMLKKEVNSTYPEGFRVPDGQLGGVKKIAVIFEKASNIRDIADFHEVIYVDETYKLAGRSVAKRVTDELCNALKSRSRSSSTTRATTSIQIYRSSVQESASIPSRGNDVSSSSSVVISLTSSSSETGMSSEHIMQQTSLTGPPIMTSVFNVSYISTQPVMKEMTHTVFVSSVSHSSNLMTFSREENKTQVLDVASIASATNTSQLINPVTIAPSSTVEVAVVASKTNQDREHVIKKLLEDRRFVLNFNTTHINVENNTFLEDYFRKSASLLQFGDVLDRTMNASRLISTPLNVLHALEKFTGTIGEAISKKNVGNFGDLEFHVGGLVSRIHLVNISTFQGMRLGIFDTDNSSVFFPREVFSHVIGNATKDIGVLVSLVFDPFQVLLEPHVFDNFEDNHTVASKIVNAFTQPSPPTQLSRPVKIFMKHSKNGYPNPQCVFWDYTKRSTRIPFGEWSKRGCNVFSSNETHTECHCDHMTNYAVLMRTTEQVLRAKDERILTVLTYVGCSFSIVGVFLTAITFLSLPVIKSEITKIHLNLSIAVGVAQVLFLAAGSENLVQREVICKLYTGFLFYCFMAVFTWMFVEGVHLYQMIVIAFVSRSMIRFYFALGWGLPACIVVIVTSIAGDGFGTSNFCWLSPVGGAIWGFVGPAVAVIGINLYVLVCVLRVRINISKKEGSKAQLRTSARVSLVLLPLLGISWIFGVLAVNDHSIVFQYIFTISNSLQGLLIFIFHCIGNSEVRHEFQRKASHLNLIRSPTGGSSLGTARVSQLPLEEVKPSKKRLAWVGGNI